MLLCPQVAGWQERRLNGLPGLVAGGFLQAVVWNTASRSLSPRGQSEGPFPKTVQQRFFPMLHPGIRLLRGGFGSILMCKYLVPYSLW
jgi:hypothetical protein